MGFDINIIMELYMCPMTGLPYYNRCVNHAVQKVYGRPAITVPPNLRKYLVGRGKIFAAYTEHFNKEGCSEIDVAAFLNRFPSWDNIVASEWWTVNGDDDDWTREDHNRFYELIQWCQNQDVDFHIRWSY